MTRLPHLEQLFPNLASVGYSPSSDPTAEYNCIAWTAGDTTRQWQGSDVDGYWPPGAVQGYEMAALVSAFEHLGYALCADGEVEDGFEKAALYMDHLGRWTHAALQLANGSWTSKIGELEDIIHFIPFALTDSDYGSVMHYMKRSLSATRPFTPPPPVSKTPSKKPKGRRR